MDSKGGTGGWCGVSGLLEWIGSVGWVVGGVAKSNSVSGGVGGGGVGSASGGKGCAAGVERSAVGVGESVAGEKESFAGVGASVAVVSGVDEDENQRQARKLVVGLLVALLVVVGVPEQLRTLRRCGCVWAEWWIALRWYDIVR